MFLNPSSIISFRTFREEGGEWRRFGKIFFAVVGGALFALLAVLEFISLRVGQTLPYDEAAAEQTKNPAMLWNDGDSHQPAFKLIRLAQVRPDVVVMGQSRMSQFRSGMFRPYSFYNLGKIAWTFGVDSDLVRRWPADFKPKVVIFSLDFFNFNPSYLAAYPSALSQSGDSGWPGQIDAWREIFSIFSLHPESILAGRRDPVGEPAIGLQAALMGDGVRLDGSESQPIPALKTAGRNADLFKTVRFDNAPIYYGDALSGEELAKFEEFIALVRARGATPIGVQMPIYGPVMRVIEQDPHYGILKDFRDRIANGYFDRLGVIVFDDATLPPYSDDYRYFIDAFHPTEAACAAVVLRMASDPRVKTLLPNLDTASLQRTLGEDRNADQHVYLYHDEF